MHELRRRWRERHSNTIIDHTIEDTDEMELDDLDDDADEVPVTTHNHDTVTNVATTSEVLFGEHTLESLSNLTNEQLLALNSDNIIVEQIGTDQVGIITITRVNESGSREVVYMRRCDNEHSVLTPEQLRYFSLRRIDTTSQLTIDNHSALEIEQMNLADRLEFESLHPEYTFINHVNTDLGVNWTEIRDSNDSTVGIINISIITRTTLRNDCLTIQNPKSNVKINDKAINIKSNELNSVGNDNVHELIANEYNVAVVNHQLEPITNSDWTDTLCDNSSSINSK